MVSILMVLEVKTWPSFFSLNQPNSQPYRKIEKIVWWWWRFTLVPLCLLFSFSQWFEFNRLPMNRTVLNGKYKHELIQFKILEYLAKAVAGSVQAFWVCCIFSAVFIFYFLLLSPHYQRNTNLSVNKGQTHTHIERLIENKSMLFEPRNIFQLRVCCSMAMIIMQMAINVFLNPTEQDDWERISKKKIASKMLVCL